MKPIVALSSCWLSHRHQDGYAMIKEMADLGFEWVELSHGIRITLVPGILKAVDEGIVKVASCHNFCPLPTGITKAAPNVYMPSALDGRERDQWLRQSKRTIDFAAQVGAKKVVMHLGSVEFFWFNPSRKVSEYIDAAGEGADLSKDERYQKVLTKSVKKLRDRMPRYWENVKKGLVELLPYAEQKGVKLGFENRERFDELPLDADHGLLIEMMAKPNACGYWHDCGHAQIKQEMCLLNHEEHLKANIANLIGFHLHDVADGDDHQPIGSGVIDFEMISRFWRPEHTLIIELSPRLTPDQVLSSKKRVEELVRARFGK